MFLSKLYFSLSQLHSLALTTLSLFSALDTSFLFIISLHSLVFVFIGEGDSLVVEKKGEWLIVVVERRGWLRKMLTIATNLHLGKIFPSNPRDRSMPPPLRHMALHPEGAQHREMLTKSKQCWNLIPETHFVSMSAGLSAVPIFCSRISPSSIISRTK